jgi:hypothetical protein
VSPSFISPSFSLPTGFHPTAQLHQLVEQLPETHYTTLAFLMAHLKRVAAHSEVNRMDTTNLGIVFGPTVLHTTNTSVSSLMHMPILAATVDLMIQHCEHIFQVRPDASHVCETVAETFSKNMGFAH